MVDISIPFLATVVETLWAFLLISFFWVVFVMCFSSNSRDRD
jgi:hypothetical protein